MVGDGVMTTLTSVKTEATNFKQPVISDRCDSTQGDLRRNNQTLKLGSSGESNSLRYERK